MPTKRRRPWCNKSFGISPPIECGLEAVALLIYTCNHLWTCTHTAAPNFSACHTVETMLMGSTSTCSFGSCVHRLQHPSKPAMLTLRPLYGDAKLLVEASCASSGLLHLGLLCLGLLPKCAFSCWSEGASAGRR